MFEGNGTPSNSGGVPSRQSFLFFPRLRQRGESLQARSEIDRDGWQQEEIVNSSG